MKEKKKLTLATKIFIALILGIIVGMALTSHSDIAVSYIKPFGTIFLNLIKWIVTPLVFFSIMAGVISMRDIKKVGSVGIKTPCLLPVHNGIRDHHRTDPCQSVQRDLPRAADNGSGL